MTRQITRHAKEIQAKSRKCAVTFNGGYRYSVVSPTGNTYSVTFAAQQGVTACTCDWGKYRPGEACGCSHVVAVAQFVAQQDGDRVAVWNNDTDAERQHRHIEVIGDGLVLTVG